MIIPSCGWVGFSVVLLVLWRGLVRFVDLAFCLFARRRLYISIHLFIALFRLKYFLPAPSYQLYRARLSGISGTGVSSIYCK
jgi:hypothetical protein